MEILLEKIHILYKSGKYDEAVTILEEIEKQGMLNPAILVKKGNCVLLGSGERYSLSDVEKMYKKALSIDNKYVEALIELGYFYLNVMDDAKHAKPYFQNAIDCLRDSMTESIIGMSKCISEIDSDEKALQFLNDVLSVTIDSAKINTQKKEF